MVASYCHITKVTKRAAANAGVMAADATLAASSAETIALSGASQRTTMTASPGETWVIAVNADTFVKIATGAPSANGAGGDLHHFLPSGTTREFNASGDAEKVAAILAT